MKLFLVVSLAAGIVLMYYGFYLYFAGFHNVDLVINYMKIGETVNPYLAEHDAKLESIDVAKDNMGLHHDSMTFVDVYCLGMDQMMAGMKFMLLSGLFFGSAITFAMFVGDKK